MMNEKEIGSINHAALPEQQGGNDNIVYIDEWKKRKGVIGGDVRVKRAPTLNTKTECDVDKKIKEVQKAVSLEDLIDGRLPNLGIIPSEHGNYTADELKDILYKAYNGTLSLEEVPRTFGLRTKISELMQKKGVRTQTSTTDYVVPEANSVSQNVEKVDGDKKLLQNNVANFGFEGKDKKETREAWKEVREQYRIYREQVKNAEALFIEKTEAFEKERHETSFLSRFIVSSKLDDLKREMIVAEHAYDVLLEGLRTERQKRMSAFVEKQRVLKNEDEQSVQKKVAYVARHEALLEQQVDSEVQLLERLRYRENDKGESRFRFVRAVKSGWNWYRTLPLKKRLMVGAGIGAVIGGSLGASGVVAGGALVAGGTAAVRRVVGGFFGSMIALETKRKGDSIASFFGEKALKKQHESFSEKALGKNRRERVAIKKNVRLGKHVATVGAGAAAFAVGSGVAQASTETLVTLGTASDAVAADVPETIHTQDVIATAEKQPDVNAPVALVEEHPSIPHIDESVSVGKVPSASYTKAAEGFARMTLEEENSIQQPPETLHLEGVYEEGANIEKELQHFLGSDSWVTHEYPHLTDVERAKIAHLMRIELMKDPSMAEKFKVHHGDWNKIWKNDHYDITVDRDFIDAEIKKIHHQNVEELDIQDILIKHGYEDEQAIQPAPEVASFTPIPDEKTPYVTAQEDVLYKDLQHIPIATEVSEQQFNDDSKIVEVKGMYEMGSSVDKELQQFLKEHEWVKKRYPALTEQEREKIATVLRTELMKDPSMAEKFKVHHGDWNKVRASDTYALKLEQSFLEQQIEKIHHDTTQPVITSEKVLPTDSREEVVVKLRIEPEGKKIKVSSQDVLSEPSTPVVEKVSDQHDVPVAEKKESSYQEHKKQADEQKRVQMDAMNKLYKPVEKPLTPSPSVNFDNYIESKEGGSATPPPTLEQELDYVGKALETEHADYHGSFSRPAIAQFFKENIFDKNLQGQRPLILSNWGPISHARMQDIMDGGGSLSYDVGGNRLTMGSQAEMLTKNIVHQLERVLHDRIPEVGEIVEHAQKDNIRLGDLVNQLSEKLKDQEVPSSRILHEDSPTPLPGKVTESVMPIAEYVRPTVSILDEAKGTFVAKMVPVEVTQETIDIVGKKYPFIRDEWSDGSADELYESSSMYRDVVDLYIKDIALDVNMGSHTPLQNITIDWESYKKMTPANALMQLEQHHRLLSKENIPIPDGRVVFRKVMN